MENKRIEVYMYHIYNTMAEILLQSSAVDVENPPSGYRCQKKHIKHTRNQDLFDVPFSIYKIIYST